MGKHKPKIKVDTDALKKLIASRGYVLEDEYELLMDAGLNKLNLRLSDGASEGIWVFPLEDDDVSGREFKFVFFNDPLGMRGPRPIAGMVGVAKSNGPDARADASSVKCAELFKSLGGQAAIDYHNRLLAEAEAKAKAAKKPKGRKK